MTHRVEALRGHTGVTGALLVVIFLGIWGCGPSEAQSPSGTDIWVFELTGQGEGLEIGSGVRATNRPGYDNQPSFLPGGGALLFTSIDDQGQADIHRFDLDREEVFPLTRSAPESEYSATVMPSGDRISVIRVEADSSQRLWSFDLDGGSPALVLQEVRPVGYHTWIDEDRLALFVLGSPATLQIASVKSGVGEVVGSNIGRSLHTIPVRGTISFVQWNESREGVIKELDPETGFAETLAPLLDGNEFYAWTPGGDILMGQGAKLFRWTVDGVSEWRELADLTSAGVTGISRIAVSPEGDRIAVVGVEG